MSNIQLVTTTNPFGKIDECGKITITEERASYYLNGCIQGKPSKYTFRSWIKSSNTTFSVQIGSCVQEFTLTPDTWTECIFKTPIEVSSFEYSSAQLIFNQGVYYIYRSKLETGTAATDWEDNNDTKDVAISAQDWTDANGNSLLELQNMILKWTNGAISDTTVINGGWIQTNTITADKIAIGDFTDYSNLNVNTAEELGWQPYIDNSNNSWFNKISVSRDSYISKWYNGQGGESFRIKANIFTSVYGQPNTENGTEDLTPLPVRIGVQCYNDENVASWFFTEQYVKTASNSGTTGTINSTLNLPSDIKSFRFFVQIKGWKPFTGNLMIKDLSIRRMTNSELIVDGSITADKLSANNIYGENGWINLKQGKFNYGNGKFVWDGELLAIDGRVTATSGKVGDFFINDALYTISKSFGTVVGNVYISNKGISLGTEFKVTQFGELTATNAKLTGKITATEGQIGGFYITSSDDYSAYSGHCYRYSLYRHSGDGTYEYEAGLRGTGTAASSSSNGDGATNKAFYINRITKGNNWSNPEAIFYVQNNGKLYASNAEIVGHITAKEGKIGDFTIQNAIYTNYKGFVNSTYKNNVYIGSDGISLGVNFRVSDTGNLYAINADLAGKITATSGKIGDFTILNSIHTLSDTFAQAGNIYLGLEGLSLGTTFKVDKVGAMTCTSGQIACWTIKPNAISYNNTRYASSNGLFFGTEGLSITDKFYVNASGDLTAISATIKGHITATTLTATAQGQIACWTINSTSIWKGSSTWKNSSGMYFGENGLSISNKFYVDDKGNLTATNADISGTINAIAGNIGGCSIVNGKLTIPNIDAGNITTGYLSADRIKVGSLKANVIKCDDLIAFNAKIGGWTIGDTSIYSNSGNTGMSSNSSSSTNNAFWASSSFKVTHGGALYASNATISGNITATSGKIANWVISGNKIQSNGTYLSSSGDVVFYVNGSAGYFKVNYNGTSEMSGQCIAKDMKVWHEYKLTRDAMDSSTGNVHSVIRLTQSLKSSGSNDRKPFTVTVGDIESDFGSIKCYNNGSDYTKNTITLGDNEVIIGQNYTKFAHMPTFNGSALPTASHTHDRFTNGSYMLKMGTASGAPSQVQPANGSGSTVNKLVQIGGKQYMLSDVYCQHSTMNTNSDRNLKHNISSLDDRHEKAFMDLKPVSYMFKNTEEWDNHDRLHWGLIAQDVEKALNDNGISNQEAALMCVNYLDKPNAFGETKQYGLRYGELISLNIFMIQRLYKRVEELEKQLKQQ